MSCGSSSLGPARRSPDRDGGFLHAEPSGPPAAAAPRVGLILPVAGCREAAMRAGLPARIARWRGVAFM